MYPSDWLGSRSVRLMDAEQRGWYIQLLMESWESEPQATLPNDDQFLRTLAGVNQNSPDFESRWLAVKSMFKTKGKRIYNERLLDEFAKQEVNREKKRLAGQASAEARKSKREVIKAEHLNPRKKKQQVLNTCSTPVELCSPSVGTGAQQNGNRSSTKSNIPSSSSVPSSSPTTTSLNSTHTLEPPRAGVCVKSKFSLEQNLQYAKASCQTDNGIKQPEAWAAANYTNGLYDEMVEAFLRDPEKHFTKAVVW